MASTANGPTEKQRREAAEASKARTRTILYTVIGVVIAVLVIALLVWHSGIFEKGKVVATVNGEDYTVAEMGYYYYPTANMYNRYGIAMDEATLRQNAVDSLQYTAALAAAAQADGFTLSEEGAASVDETIASLRTYAAQSGLSFTAYIRNAYGPYMTESLLRECLTRDTLVQEYYNDHSDSLTYEESEIQAYYEEHADELDTFTYSAVFIDGTVESTTDDSGNTVEPTEEETAAAMADAQAAADQMIQDLEAGGDFDTLAAAAEAMKAIPYEDHDSPLMRPPLWAPPSPPTSIPAPTASTGSRTPPARAATSPPSRWPTAATGSSASRSATGTRRAGAT